MGVLLVQLLNLLNIVDNDLRDASFALISLFYLTSVLLTIIFSLKDFFRISNRLMKVRLGMIIIAGVIYILHLLVLMTYFVLAALVSDTWTKMPVLLTFLMIGMHIILFLVAPALYFCLFVPIKLQELTGILPPSYKILIEKQRFITKAQQAKIQGS